MFNLVEMVKIYVEVVQCVLCLIIQFVEKKVKDGVNVLSDEFGVVKVFMDFLLCLLVNLYKMVQIQMNMMWDYFLLW